MLNWQSILWSALAIGALLLTSGWTYERIGEWRDARSHPAPGRRISVGARNLHLLCKGSESPTVVIEQGAGEPSKSWWPLQDQIAEFARVCTYDRPGYGWSEPAPAGRTIGDRADELRALLSAAGMPGPYLLVAHSYGGLIVRDFALKHPDEVAGLVLIDTPEQSSIFQREVLDFYSKARIMNRAFGFAARFGMLRLLRHWLPLERFGIWFERPQEFAALCDDLASVEHAPASMRNSPKAGSLGSLPVAVLTHGVPFPPPFAVLETNWSQGQDRLAASSTNSLLVVAAKSTHMIQHDEPGLVIDTIRRIHASVRGQQPLAYAEAMHPLMANSDRSN